MLFGDVPNYKKYDTLKFFNTEPYGLGISKYYFSYIFHLISSKVYEDICHQGRIEAVIVLGNWPSFSLFIFFSHFEILPWKSVENPKMCNILKTTNPRANRVKIWNSQFNELQL